MRKDLLPLALLFIVNTLGFSILIPVLPFVVEKYTGTNPFLYGVILSAYPIFQFFATPVLGTLSDRWGRKPVLVLSQAGTLISWVIFAIAYFVPAIPVFGVPLPIVIIILARIFDGITGGNNSVANAYVADITKPEDRSKAYGMLGGIMGIGFLLGPALGGVTSSSSLEFVGTAIFAIIVSTVTLIFIITSLKESLPPSKRSDHIEFSLKDEINFLYKLGKFKDNPYLMNLFLVRILYVLVFSAYTSIIILYIRERFELNPNELGILFLFIGGFFIFNQAVSVKFFVDRIGPFRSLCYGMLIMAGGLFTVPYADTLWSFTLNAFINNLGIALTMTTIRTLVSTSVDHSRQGEVAGVDEALMSLGTAIAPLVSGYIYSHIGAYSFDLYSIVMVLFFGIFLYRHIQISKKQE